jgi:hypothetical protein
MLRLFVKGSAQNRLFRLLGIAITHSGPGRNGPQALGHLFQVCGWMCAKTWNAF